MRTARHHILHNYPTALERLTAQEASGQYFFSGTPLTFAEMSRQIPGGGWERRLLPAIPLNGSADQKRFAPDAQWPVVCVTSLARLAVFRALSHQSLHANLPKYQRRTGWTCPTDGSPPIPRATAAVIQNVRNLMTADIWVEATVVGVKRSAAPFEPLEREPHQWRSAVPVPFKTPDVTTVTLDLWPDDVEECEPWPEDFDLSSYADYQPESDAYLQELLRERSYCFS